MNIFQKIADKLFGPKETQTAIPGAMGDLLAQMGIHELGPHKRSGTPINVLMGCKPELTIVPGAGQPAMKKDGTPMISKDKHGRPYQVMDQYAIPTKRWKQMMREQERKAAGRWYSGAEASA